MAPVFLAAIILLVAGYYAWKKFRKTGDAEHTLPFLAKQSLLSEPEQDLYWRLLAALPGLIVLGQVALNRVIQLERSVAKDWRWRRRLDGRSLDFVICRKDGTVVAAIELDISSHRNRSRSESAKNRILDAAGIPLLRWSANSLPSLEEIKRQIAPLLVSRALGRRLKKCRDATQVVLPDEVVQD